MQSQFNVASLARLRQSEIYAHLADYRKRLGVNGEAPIRLATHANIQVIKTALIIKNKPG